MQRIGLDFSGHNSPVASVGGLFLLLGILAMAAALGANFFYWQPRLAAGENALRAVRAALLQRYPAAPKINDRQLAVEWIRAIAVAGDLNRPWEKLFGVFEAQADGPVGLLSFEPDVAKGELAVTGEARDFEAMLAYYRMLQQQDMLSAVTLHTHQVNQQDKDKPIRFRITAKWGVQS